MKSSATVATADINSDPRQPSRFEKKKNMCCHIADHLDEKVLATARAPHSSVSRAIFCASITSPATRLSLGTKHQPMLGRSVSSSSRILVPVPWRIRYRFPLWQPVTSKYLCASYCASCSGESHALNSPRPRASRSFPRPSSRNQSQPACAPREPRVESHRSGPLAICSRFRNIYPPTSRG
jgi:hypothetical protein